MQKRKEQRDGYGLNTLSLQSRNYTREIFFIQRLKHFTGARNSLADSNAKVILY